MLLVLIFTVFLGPSLLAQEAPFQWPEGKQMAISLTFDDGRASQVDVGTPLFDEYGVKATFVVVPSNVELRLDQWKQAAKNGHEIGNHTIQHPCSGNFAWARENALENYTLDQMRAELIETSSQLETLVGINPSVFAYPCGATFVGRGTNTQSYIPLIAELFTAGRGWLDEGPNDPAFCDLAQLTGMEMDGKDFDEIKTLIDQAKTAGSWLVLAGHEVGDAGSQTTRVDMLRKLIAYAKNPANGIWIAPMGEIATYVQDHRPALNVPKVTTSKNGILLLKAQDGKGIGPKIEYMPEWKAFGWFTEADRVEWDVEVKESGEYDVYLDWSVSNEEAGKPFMFVAAGEQIKGMVKESGSWENFKREKIGRISLAPGLQKMVFRPGADVVPGPLLDLRTMELVKVK